MKIKLYINRIVSILNIVKAIFFRGIAKLIREQNYWVIMERGKDARDNAYFLYKYMKQKHPEQKVYYIIDKKSPDYDKVKNDAVQFKSLRSYIILFTAQKIISTHYAKGLGNIPYRYFKFSGLHKKYYFLQHGVIKDSHQELFGENAPMQLFVCGAYPEYKFISETYGHPEGVVQYTGLVRFDNLHDIKVKRQILVMPTWRKKDVENFEDSNYLKKWNSFLANERLADALEKNDLQLIFYPHFVFQKYLHLFKSNTDRVTIASFNDFDVQELLKESAVLVTDFSSVYFDFAYMKKPVVYYQFDYEDFFRTHYQKGYFDYNKMGFGKVCTDEESAVREVLNIIEQGLKMDEYYLKRIEKFFPLHDRKNAERVYNIIMGK